MWSCFGLHLLIISHYIDLRQSCNYAIIRDLKQKKQYYIRILIEFSLPIVEFETSADLYLYSVRAQTFSLNFCFAFKAFKHYITFGVSLSEL